MKKSYYLFYIIFLACLLISCSARYIRVNSLNEYYEAKKGDSVRIEWNISNADFVRIEGFEKRFKVEDNFTIVADSSTHYILTAYHGKRDSINRKIVVSAKNKDAISGIEYIEESQTKLFESTELSEFFKGIKDFKEDIYISKLKITGINKNADLNTEYKLNFILLDDFGNFIDNLDLDRSNFMLSANQSYGNEKHTHIYNKISRKEKKYSDIGVLLDNSMSEVNQTEILKEIKIFVENLSPYSNIMFSAFNHKYKKIIELNTQKSALSQFNQVNLSPDGLSSIYQGIYQSLTDLSSSKNENRILIVILSNTDNSSTLKDYSDCLELSKKFRIPVYFVIMNDYISSYPMRYLAYQSGGYVCFKSDYGEKFQLSSVLSEIELSYRYQYELTLPIYADIEKNKVVRISLNLIQDEKKINDQIDFFVNEINSPFEKKIIATFEENKYNLKEDYSENIFSLAQILEGNPDKIIRLTGHSSKSENGRNLEPVSLRRTNEIKEKLLILGVREHQIEISDLGSSKPIYFLEQEEWQKEMNQRVEFKWIEPSALPYEIVAQTTNSEYGAIKLAEEWEREGFASYFERIETDGEPFYRIKLWGFSSKDEAEKVIRKLNQKYSQIFDIE